MHAILNALSGVVGKMMSPPKYLSICCTSATSVNNSNIVLLREQYLVFCNLLCL